MRCLPIRSVFRAALLAGLIGSSQSATVSASWKDCMPPRNGSCFIHDLHWERYQPQPVSIDTLASSLVAVEETEIQVAERELKLCIAAAKQFELEQQVEAIQAAIQSKLTQLPTVATNLVASYTRSKQIFRSFLEDRKLNVAKAPVIPESVPETAAVANGLVAADESVDDNEWNCGDWCRGNSRPRTVSLPSREVANIFVYTLDASSTTSIDSNSPVASSMTANSESMDSCSMAFSEYIGDNLLTEAEISQWNSAIASEITHPWQVGVDPVCSEVQSLVVAVQSQSSFENRSVCCPIDGSAEAVSKVANAENAQVEMAMVDDAKVDDAKVDDAKVDDAKVDDAVVNHAVADFAARPPILEAEIEMNDFSPGTEFDGRQPVHCLISDFDAATFASDRYNDLFGDYGYAHPLLGSVNAPRWLNGQVKRFAFGDIAPRMPFAQPPVTAFSKEDLQFANRFSANLLGNSPSQGDETRIEEPNPRVNESTTFLSKDFLTTIQRSVYGSIVLPVNQTKQMAMDYAAQVISETASTSRTHASRKVASQLRTIGQFLVDFATQIEKRVEQVEIARGENKRLESNQR